jgi:hypothetical protein
VSDIQQMSVDMQQLVDFISTVANSPLLCYAINATTCWMHFHRKAQTYKWNETVISVGSSSTL